MKMPAKAGTCHSATDLLRGHLNDLGVLCAEESLSQIKRPPGLGGSWPKPSADNVGGSSIIVACFSTRVQDFTASDSLWPIVGDPTRDHLRGMARSNSQAVGVPRGGLLTCGRSRAACDLRPATPAPLAPGAASHLPATQIDGALSTGLVAGYGAIGQR